MLDVVIFGGVGDLSFRKLLPSLYHLYKGGDLPESTRILCVSRNELERSEFIALVGEKLKYFLKDEFEEKCWNEFSLILNYQNIDLSLSDDWHKLREFLDIDVNDHDIIYYLSVTPTLFSPICVQLKSNKLNPKNSRVIVEKPLGEDFESANEINAVLAQSFKEKQIYRIDHYLGKEAVQNILHLRFSNHLMETIWNKDHIDRVEITVSETVGVEGRAQFLDRTGALRDMVQNHLMQLLTYITMEAPVRLAANDIRDQKVKIIKALRPIDKRNVGTHTIRAQYLAGEIDGAELPSYQEEILPVRDKVQGTGETFVALKVNIDNERWDGVPFYLRTGKRLNRRFAEIRIKFKPPSNNLYKDMDNNQLIIEIQPDLTVSIHMLMKQVMGNDAELNSHRNQMDLNDSDENAGRVPEAYERLLSEVIKGNQTYFVRDDEIMASWLWIDGIRDAWTKTNQKMQDYAAGSNGPELS